MSYRRFGTMLASAGLIGCLLVAQPPLVAQEAGDDVEKAAAAAEAAAAEAAKRVADAEAQLDQLQQNPGQPGLDPNSFYGKESTEGVYVRDSALALEKFALAQRMERLKEWTKSADLYQEVIEKYPDRVVPSRTNDDDKIVQYTSVTRGVMERLAKWPKEGLDVYRARFEPTAAALIDAAGGMGAGGDLAEMHRVFYRYFVTETAKNVGLRLVDINLERGEFQAAARLADELANWHPGIGAERPATLYRAALAHRLAGDEAKAKERLATLRKNHADAKGLVRGTEVNLADSLARELQGVTSLGDASAVASADSWTTLGGDPSRGRVANAAGRPGARLFNVALSRGGYRNFPVPNRVELEKDAAANNATGARNGVFPVVDRGELFFQDGTRVYARSLESGIALPGWAQTYPGERDGAYALPNAIGAPRTHQLSLTLTDRAVLGVMGQPDRSLFGVGAAPGGEARLVCLDRQTGKENWVVALSALELPKDLPEDQQKSVRGLQMNGAPLVIGDSVLVAARGVKQAQFEDCWVLCFHLPTGKYRWSCYVASASTVGAMYGVVPMQGVESTTHLAYANGRVYVLTNLGALAALDAYSGTIVWLNIYERPNAGPNEGFNAFGNRGRNVGIGGGMDGSGAPRKPWEYNPVIAKDGRVFSMPAEGRYLYVYDANGGDEVKRIRRADFGNADLLLAVIGERAVVASEIKLYCVNWKAYAEEKPEDALVWSSVDFGTPQRGGLKGRPFVTADSVFVTNESRLSRVDLKSGRVVDTYPKDYAKSWDAKEEGPGNVLVTADHVVIAGATHVYGYTDLGLARARLDREVAASPSDTGIRLRYAEIMFTAGEPLLAMSKLDEAIKLLGGLGAMRNGANRDRVFADALAFAQKIGAADDRPDSIKLAGDLYDRAAAAAATPPQQVHYRLSRARFAEGAAKDPAGAAALYQQILSEAELRPVPLLDEASGGPTQAAAVAEQAIQNLIQRSGKAIYEPFEQAAAKELDAANAASPPQPERLLSVAQTFPNAAVAPQAMVAAADAYEAAKQPRVAVQVLRQMYFKYPDNPDKPRIIESMARNYLALPNRVEVAAARLAQGASLPGEHKLSRALRLPDGREIPADVTFAKALDEVRKFSGQAAAKNLPDFKLPVPPKYPPAAERQRNPRWPFPPAGDEPVIADVDALAVPLRDFARADRVVTWSADGRVRIYAPGADQPLGVVDALPASAARGSAWVGGGAVGGGADGRVVVWNDTAVALVNERGGPAPAWQLDVRDLPNVEIVKAGTVAEVAPPQPARRGGIPAGRRGQLIMPNQQFRIAGGVGAGGPFPVLPGMQPRVDGNAVEQISEVRPVGDRVLVATSTGRVCSVELAGGRVAWQTRFTDRPADRVAANEDFTVLKVSDDASVRLVAMDTYTGRILGTKAFAVQTGSVPSNIALAADGTLVYTMPSTIVLKDLYKPWDASERDVGSAGGQAGGGMPAFMNATGPDQLVVAEGRILALAEAGIQPNGNNKKYVRVHSLETGQPITLRVPQDGAMVDLQLVAGTDSWDVALRVIGPRLYVVNPHTVLCYNLDRPEEFWEGWVDVDDQSTPNVSEALFGQNHVVLLSQPGLAQQAKGRFQLLAYGRYPGKPGDTAESGRIDYEPTIVEQGEVRQWQGVEGGFYYLTADRKLHYLAAGQ